MYWKSSMELFSKAKKFSWLKCLNKFTVMLRLKARILSTQEFLSRILGLFFHFWIVIVLSSISCENKDWYTKHLAYNLGIKRKNVNLTKNVFKRILKDEISRNFFPITNDLPYLSYVKLLIPCNEFWLNSANWIQHDNKSVLMRNLSQKFQKKDSRWEV